MNVVPILHKRTFIDASQLEEKKRALKRLLVRIDAAVARAELHRDDEIYPELADHREALRSEARSMIEELTGCEWGLIAEGNL